MDHRYSVRLPRRLTVEVFKRERFLGRYVTRNMDVEGVFIEMPTSELEANEVVKLTFAVPGSEICDYTMLAGVARLDADGVGMMLFDHKLKALNILRAVDLSRQLPGRRVQTRPGSSNADNYGYALKYQA